MTFDVPTIFRIPQTSIAYIFKWSHINILVINHHCKTVKICPIATEWFCINQHSKTFDENIWFFLSNKWISMRTLPTESSNLNPYFFFLLRKLWIYSRRTRWSIVLLQQTSDLLEWFMIAKSWHQWNYRHLIVRKNPPMIRTVHYHVIVSRDSLMKVCKKKAPNCPKMRNG